MNKKTLMIVGGVVLLLIVAGAINRSMQKTEAEKVIESATGGNASVNDNGEVTVRTDQGTWSSSGQLPKDFPSDVPLYPGSKVQASVAADQQQGGGQYVGLESTDSSDKVVTWYKQQLPAKGWKLSTNFETGGGVMFSGTKDTRNVMVTVAADSGKTIIGLVVTKTQ